MAGRIAVIGNRGGGKSTLARRLATRHALPHVEIDLWLRPPFSLRAYEDEHVRLVARDGWLIDGLGRRESIALRLDRATTIVLVDLPLWLHGALPSWDTPPSIWPIEDIERDWMPDIRRHCTEAERRGADVVRLESAEAVERYAAELGSV